MSIQLKYHFLERVYPDMLAGTGMLIQKAKLSNRFKSIQLTEEEVRHLQKAKELCELEIISLWNNQRDEAFKALCSTYFDIASQLMIYASGEQYIYEQIKLITFGYLGEHWHFVRQYLILHKNQFEQLEINEDWNQRLLTLSFKSLAGLIIKDSWNSIDESVQLINRLRAEQGEFESNFLNQVQEENRPFGAAELVSLYHFAKSIDILGGYLVEGRPLEPEDQIRYHLEYSKEFAQKSGNITLELLFQFFEAFAVKLIRNTIWYTTRGVNHWVSAFNEFITHKEDKGIFELLYPQRESIIAGQLLNPAHRAIVVNLPTSSGKTMIAEYRILQALNQFKHQGGWVAYVVPTKTLVNQVFIQLNRDLGAIGLRVEKASGAVELDGFERHLVEESGNRTDFDVLVTTYEKLNLLVRQGLGTTRERSLVLAVVDEAHNIEEATRGLTLEFLLSTIKNDCEDVNFLLMTPDISNSMEIADWLAGDRGRDIHLNLHWWQPNERVVGAIKVEGRGRNYSLYLETLHTDKGTYEVGEKIPLAKLENAEKAKSEIYGLNGSKKQVAAVTAAEMLNIRSPLIVLARHPNETYDIAEILYQKSRDDFEEDEDINLVKRLVESELGTDFPLAKYLERRIAVHSSALPGEIRLLIEDLMVQENKIQALVATTTIAQGINFPVSVVIMGSYAYPSKTGSYDMPVRDFWNLAGRVGRTGQQDMGWVGIALSDDADLQAVGEYVLKASDELHSQLVKVIDQAMQYPDQEFDRYLFFDERWSAILQYISHLRRQTEQLEHFLAQLEQKLQGTLGYRQLPQDKKAFFNERIRRYAATLTQVEAKRADETGFSTVTVRQMIGRLHAAGLTPQDWNKNQLFSDQNQSLRKLIGIMLNTYEIKKSLEELSQGDRPLDHASISRLIIEWVNGNSIAYIANRFYTGEDSITAIKKTTKALYKIVANAATWGMAALQQMPNSGIVWENLSDIEKKRMANIPAYLHYGVNTDEGVLMRKNNVPRSIANRLGELYSASVNGEIFEQPANTVSQWIAAQNNNTWDRARPANSSLSAEDYRKIWMKLNGIIL